MSTRHVRRSSCPERHMSNRRRKPAPPHFSAEQFFRRFKAVLSSAFPSVHQVPADEAPRGSSAPVTRRVRSRHIARHASKRRHRACVRSHRVQTRRRLKRAAKREPARRRAGNSTSSSDTSEGCCEGGRLESVTEGDRACQQAAAEAPSPGRGAGLHEDDARVPGLGGPIATLDQGPPVSPGMGGHPLAGRVRVSDDDGDAATPSAASTARTSPRCKATANEHGTSPSLANGEPRYWLTYRQAAEYCGWSVAYLRNLVSAGQIPVYGKPRVRRFRRDMLDLFLTDPDAAMRRFRSERTAHGS